MLKLYMYRGRIATFSEQIDLYANWVYEKQETIFSQEFSVKRKNEE